MGNISLSKQQQLVCSVIVEKKSWYNIKIDLKKDSPSQRLILLLVLFLRNGLKW